MMSLAVIWLLYALASFFPSHWTWGFSAAHLLSPTMRLAILTLPLPFFVPVVRRQLEAILSLDLTAPRRRHLVTLLLPVVAGVALFMLHLEVEIYGDRAIVSRDLAETPFEIGRLWGALTGASVQSVSRELGRGWASLCRLLGINLCDAFALLGPLIGTLVILFWIRRILPSHKGANRGHGAALITLLAGGVWLLYAGHIEDYLFPYALLTASILTGWRALDRGKSWIPSVVLFALAVRLHALSIVLLPAECFLITLNYRRFATGGVVVTRRIIYAACGTAGVIIYLALGGWRSAYWEEISWSRTFLPLTIPDGAYAAYDYHLLSSDHLLDLVNVFGFLLGGPALVTLSWAFLERVGRSHARGALGTDGEAKRHEHVGAYLSMAAVFPMLFSLAVNPRLTPQRDWDLFAVGAFPVLIWLTWRLTRQPRIAYRMLPGRVAPLFLGASILSAPAIWIHVDSSTTTARIRTLGHAAYSGYYKGSAYILAASWRRTNDTHKQIALGQEDLARLPVPGDQDPERSDLLIRIARYYASQGAFGPARLSLDKAEAACPDLRPDVLMARALVEARAGRTMEARKFMEQRAAIVGESDEAAQALRWAIDEMERDADR